MPKVTYSAREKEEVKLRLLQAGLDRFSREGVKNTRLADILKEVGISKPFFYTFFTSKEEFVLHVLNFQTDIIYKSVDREMARTDLEWKDKLYHLLSHVLGSCENQPFVMTQEEEVYVFEHLSQAHYHAFQLGQILFYTHLMAICGIPQGRLDPKVLANLLLSILLVSNSAVQSMPFLYHDSLSAAAQIQIHTLIDYLDGLRQ